MAAAAAARGAILSSKRGWAEIQALEVALLVPGEGESLWGSAGEGRDLRQWICAVEAQIRAHRHRERGQSVPRAEKLRTLGFALVVGQGQGSLELFAVEVGM